MKFSSISIAVAAILANVVPAALAHSDNGIVHLRASPKQQELGQVESHFLSHSTQVMEEKVSFIAWAKQFEKEYRSFEEMSERFVLWASSIAQIDRHNMRTDVSYELELNKYSDMTHNEFLEHYGMDKMLGKGQDCSATGSYSLTGEQLPVGVDWRNKGVVSHVKNQGKCGSCWTFSTTGALEAHHAIKTGEHVLLSEQQLVDCAQNFNNHGCEGGLPSHAFEYIHYNGGLDTETAYPYLAKDEPGCHFNKAGIGATVQGVHNITAYNEDEMMDALAHVGPVSIAFQVASDFRLYKSGVYDSTVCKNGPMDVNHAVLAVGYGQEEDGTPYFLVKNSWGPTWGIDGYFKIVRGKNMCGLSMCASFPIV